jgi:uncharacterized membrane protein
MTIALTYGLLGFVMILLTATSYKLSGLIKAAKEKENPSGEERLNAVQNLMYTLIVLVIITALTYTYYCVKNSPWESHLMEWLNIIVRVMHITFGIAWIGASFYFVFLENALNRTDNVRDELAGNLWAVHGGGFYYLEKYKIAPKQIPKHLHWFKYEAYFTWVSGFCLLFIVYYFNASALLIDKNVMDVKPWQAISIGIGSFVVAWLIYDVLCKTVLKKNNLLFTIIGFGILVGFAFFYAHVFSARAAFIHFGAMIGSIMVANVFFVIIPSQKAMVKAAKENKPLNPQLGKNALARSLHNNYFTLPVLFVMVSNHFPSTFGYKFPWITLMIITLASAGIKHYLNLREKNIQSFWVFPISVAVLLAAAFISAPAKNPNACKSDVSINEINSIIQKRCVSCHSSRPTDDFYKTAPNGVVYDTPEDIVKKKDLIMQRVVITKTMPQNNKTNITEEERNLIRCWIEQGAKIK